MAPPGAGPPPTLPPLAALIAVERPHRDRGTRLALPYAVTIHVFDAATGVELANYSTLARTAAPKVGP
jgi:hypothetical protein